VAADQRRQTGAWFRRQVVIGRFIVDFAARAARVVIEVDGEYHCRRRTADARRDRALQRHGYRVLRLEAELVLKHPEEAIALIHEALTPPA
jgi:very-short-patch-repair endonuclease